MNSWNELEIYFRKKRERRISSLFDEDPARADRFSLAADGMLLDFSKTSIDDESLSMLLEALF